MNETIRDKVLELHYEIAKLKRKLLHEKERNARIAERTIVGFGTPLQACDPRDRRALRIAAEIRGEYKFEHGLNRDD
jgi:hypothetical protein